MHNTTILFLYNESLLKAMGLFVKFILRLKNCFIEMCLFKSLDIKICPCVVYAAGTDFLYQLLACYAGNNVYRN